MRLENQTKKRYIFLAFFIVGFLFTRLPGIESDVVNPDAVNWHGRAEQFVVGLKHFQLEKTYQHYQPGVTLMWLVGPTVEAVKQLNGDLVYNQDTFLVFHHYSKVVLIFVQLALTMYGIHLLSKLIGFNKAFLTFSLFSIEPFFVANSRVLHLDVLLALLLFNGLLLTYLFYKEKKCSFGVMAGVLLGFATLTKSVALGGVLMASGFVFLYRLKEDGFKKALCSGFTILVPAVLVFVAFLPALWVNMREVLEFLYDGIERVGIRRGHNQIIFGNYTKDAGAIFYPLVFALKTSPFLLAALALSSSKTKKINIKKPSLSFFLTIFFVGYLVVMTYSSKKIDRYFLPVYPYLGLMVVLGVSQLKDLLKNTWFRGFSVLLFLFFVILPLFKLHPYHFTYTNPLFGKPQDVHENILAQKPFGVGIPALKDYLRANYGNPTLGFVDKKPMAAIYAGSKIFDINIDGTKRYDIMVLGVNEEVPEKVLQSESKYVLKDTLFINELEYWKIYVKQNTEIN
ncbi:hypothetical protein HN803_01655 [candidate division WWE3 bacterium]|jgi:hypothetical protein|nr:hypothetical protein [candidate division WWE3 bacterium]MBT7349476.1 hypothetical protein [candidate division WWE3 bacterium]